MKPNDMLIEYAPIIEEALQTFMPDDTCLHGEVIRAMKYSLLGGGKRLRPALVLEFYRLCGGDIEEVLPFACAVEMIHTYSLIHDDLPCMDDDSFRRGQPTCHKAFSEEIALLAGDALLTLAFKTAAGTDNPAIKPGNIVKAIAVLADAAGVNGMIGGQVIDLKSENESVSLSVLEEIHSKKTGRMFNVCAEIGCLLADAEFDKKLKAVEYTSKLGLAFQIRDDILDVIGDKAKLGKDINSDIENQKSTYVSLLGLKKSEEIVNRLSSEAKFAIGAFSSDSIRLQNLADRLAYREV
ncbi:MAG: geranyl transferase [Clostridiales bacterium 43-6]|nr:MAG: geranyl transferase [Clostridiales bacterium 43-6]